MALLASVTLLPAERRHPHLAIRWAIQCLLRGAHTEVLSIPKAASDAEWLGHFLYRLARLKRGRGTR